MTHILHVPDFVWEQCMKHPRVQELLLKNGGVVVKSDGTVLEPDEITIDFDEGTVTIKRTPTVLKLQADERLSIVAPVCEPDFRRRKEAQWKSERGFGRFRGRR